MPQEYGRQMCTGPCTPSAAFGILKVVEWIYSNASEPMTPPNLRSHQTVLTGAMLPVDSKLTVSLSANTTTRLHFGAVILSRCQGSTHRRPTVKGVRHTILSRVRVVSLPARGETPLVTLPSKRMWKIMIRCFTTLYFGWFHLLSAYLHISLGF